MATSTLAPCQLFYIVSLDSASKPIPSTMRAKNNAKLDVGYKCVEARVTGAPPPAPPAGYYQCKSQLRYWYQIKFVPNGTGTTQSVIVPNSMIAVKGHPISAQNGYCWIEQPVFLKLPA